MHSLLLDTHCKFAGTYNFRQGGDSTEVHSRAKALRGDNDQPGNVPGTGDCRSQEGNW